MRATALITATIVSFMTAGLTGAKAGEPIQCTCYFQQSSGYSAVGTRAACSAMTRKNLKGPGERCEISFGATGYDQRLLSGADVKAADYRNMAFSVTQRNLEASLTGRFDIVADPGYLRVAIPAYLRAVYLRSSAEIDAETRADLDKQIDDISSEYANRIGSVFSGKEPPFEVTWHERHQLTVNRGAIRFVYASDINLVAVFFDPENVR